MGYRSTFISEALPIHKLPDWLKEKYKDTLVFTESTIATKYEIKIYGETIFEDIQKALLEVNLSKTRLVTIGEDGSVSKVIISPNSIKYYKYWDMDTETSSFIHLF